LHFKTAKVQFYAFLIKKQASLIGNPLIFNIKKW